jgi:hypothetical protein
MLPSAQPGVEPQMLKVTQSTNASEMLSGNGMNNLSKMFF